MVNSLGVVGFSPGMGLLLESGSVGPVSSYTSRGETFASGIGVMVPYAAAAFHLLDKGHSGHPRG